MFKTDSQERGGTHASLFASRLCNYACNWHTASYLYCGECCPTATNLLIGATAFLGQTVDHMTSMHTYTDKYSLSLSHKAKCFHRGRWCVLFAWLLLFLPKLNINMTRKRWHLHWLKMAVYLQWFFTKSDSPHPHMQDSFLFSVVIYLFMLLLRDTPKLYSMLLPVNERLITAAAAWE